MSKTVLYAKDQIRKRLEEIAEQIAKDYNGKQLALVSILKGSFIVTADLLRSLYSAGLQTVDVEFIRVKSYGTGHESNRNPQIITDITTDLTNKHVLIVEDIIDTGYTLDFVKKHLSKKHPLSIKIFAMLDKEKRREIPVAVDYTGFILEGSSWVEGYGLDGGEFGRGNPDIVEKS